MTLYVLRIEVDGHWHGSGEVPQPWVARVEPGANEKYGLNRTFVDRMNDWRDARRAWSGNKYGVVATWALREGAMYEVCRARGRASKRHMAREFRWCEDGKMHERTADDAIDLAEQDSSPAAVVELRDDPDDRPWVAEVTGLGMPRHLAFATVSNNRRFRLREGCVYELAELGERRLVRVMAGKAITVSQEEAFAWLQRSA